MKIHRELRAFGYFHILNPLLLFQPEIGQRRTCTQFEGLSRRNRSVLAYSFELFMLYILYAGGVVVVFVGLFYGV